MVDPIADMLIRIKNAQAVKQPEVRIPFSRIKFDLLQILDKESFVGKIEKKGKEPHKHIRVSLKYEGSLPAISDAKRISKPSQRVYAGYQDIKPVKQGYGLRIISTSKGLMSDKEARKQKIGGEVLCEVW
jgi:small subunit ribosomal protein S8